MNYELRKCFLVRCKENNEPRSQSVSFISAMMAILGVSPIGYLIGRFMTFATATHARVPRRR